VIKFLFHEEPSYSRTLATMKDGKLYNISSNLRHIAEYGNPDFDYALGDTPARI